jgi:two-component system nitrate/nitrite response regulator NarL
MSGYLLAEALGRNSAYHASAISSSDLLSGIRAHKPDLVVISSDLYANPGRGMELAEAVNRSYPEVLIIISLDHAERGAVINAFRCGARGVFFGRQSLTELLDCVKHVYKGGIWAGRTETNYLLEAFRSIPAPNVRGSSRSLPLTKRESEVVRLAAQGKTNRTIANELGLSEHTVKNYLFRTFEKLGVSSRVELLFYLTTQGHGWSTVSPEDAKLKPPLNCHSEVLDPSNV